MRRLVSPSEAAGILDQIIQGSASATICQWREKRTPTDESARTKTGGEVTRSSSKMAKCGVSSAACSRITCTCGVRAGFRVRGFVWVSCPTSIGRNVSQAKWL
eukprot:3516649-Rhodomonas_salina.1